MKMRFVRVFSIVLMCMMIASTGISEMIINGIPMSEFTIELDTVGNNDWLHEQIADKDERIYQDLATAFYIAHTIQYGPNTQIDGDEMNRPGIDSLISWMELMNFDCEITAEADVTTIAFSSPVYMLLKIDEEQISKIEIVLQGIENLYGTDIKISIPI